VDRLGGYFSSLLSESEVNREYASSKFSQLTFKESHDRLALFFLKACEVAPLKFEDAACAAAIATAMCVHDCREILSIDKGSALAIYGFVEGTKTASFPVAEGTTAPTSSAASSQITKAKKAWYKLW
jgi:hypothetical protein